MGTIAKRRGKVRINAPIHNMKASEIELIEIYFYKGYRHQEADDILKVCLNENSWQDLCEKSVTLIAAQSTRKYCTQNDIVIHYGDGDTILKFVGP